MTPDAGDSLDLPSASGRTNVLVLVLVVVALLAVGGVVVIRRLGRPTAGPPIAPTASIAPDVAGSSSTGSVVATTAPTTEPVTEPTTQAAASTDYADLAPGSPVHLDCQVHADGMNFANSVTLNASSCGVTGFDTVVIGNDDVDGTGQMFVIPATTTEIVVDGTVAPAGTGDPGQLVVIAPTAQVKFRSG